MNITESNETSDISANDPLMVGDRESSESVTRMPSSHSAALAIGFFGLCILLYGVYRLYRKFFWQPKLPFTVNLSDEQENPTRGLEVYAEERAKYDAIYGSKRMNNSDGNMEKEMDSVKKNKKF
ncbi:uncharacterized protein [Parasteatoda tepidariorum]|uniref:uncharacterized protein n=1 Tax=Parasteatoda tepidariorum TaxID=114398 RepID=UPI001C71F0C5|nr:uncharacterized protein LOC122272207 [Parasteatoda tepidariorum]